MRIDIPADKRLVFEHRLPIRWGDMDAMGHVNNAVYFRYMETVRIDWFQTIGCRPETIGVGPLIVNAFCNFIRQLEYPGEILARHYVGAMGRSSVDTYTLLSRTDDPDTVVAAGGATVVWTDYHAQRSVPIPDDMRRLMAG